MSHHDCTCGHLPDDHTGKYGRCEGECVDSEYGRYGCMCFAYEKAHDD